MEVIDQKCARLAGDYMSETASTIDRSPVLLSDKRERFIEAFLGEACGVASRAAKVAGYGSPNSVGPRLKKQLWNVIEARRHALEDKTRADAREVLEGLTTLARDDSISPSTRLKAWEVLAKIHGLLSERINVTMDRGELEHEMRDAIGMLARLKARELQSGIIEGSAKLLSHNEVDAEVPISSHSVGNENVVDKNDESS